MDAFRKRPRLRLQLDIFQSRTFAKTYIYTFTLFTLLVIAARAGAILNIAFPLGCLIMGLLLYRRYEDLYLGSIWSVLFLTPLVRRLADQSSSFQDPSPILLAPYMVVLVSGMTLLRRAPSLKRVEDVPFIFSLCGLVYGCIVSMLSGNVSSGIIVAWMEWLAPLFLAYHLASNWRLYPYYRDVTLQVFKVATLLAGVYGIFQYLAAPSWDIFWMENVALTSIGTPTPRGIRVWGTMHSPGVFATYLVAGLLLLLNQNQKKIGNIANIAGYISLMLTLVRSSWLAWVVGVFDIFSRSKPHRQLNMIKLAVMAIAILMPLVFSDSFADGLLERFQTFGNIEGDHSANARQMIYAEWLNKAISSVVGSGLGRVPSLDSGVLNTWLELGWVGGIAYCFGLFLLIYTILRSTIHQCDAFVSSARGIVISFLPQILLGSVFLGPVGSLFWTFLALSLAAILYYAHLDSKSHPPTWKEMAPQREGSLGLRNETANYSSIARRYLL